MHSRPRLTICPGTATYQRNLPLAAWRRGWDVQILRVTGHHGTYIIDDAGREKRVRAFPMLRATERAVWAAWRRVPLMCHSRWPQAALAKLVGDTLATNVREPDVFHGLTTFSIASIERLQRSGRAALIEHNVIHATDWQQRTVQECETAGIHPRDSDAVFPAGIARRMLREYELCDAVMVRSASAQLSFESFGCRGKAVVVWAGVDPTKFFPATRRPGQFRVLFVGRLELGKGIHYLLDAWKHFSLAGELVLIGQVRHEARLLLDRHPRSSIKVLGPVPLDRVADEMRTASVFVMPSVNDALPRSILEAMSCGLPVVATDTSGAGDCVVNGVSGFIVPGRDPSALAESIGWLHRHPADSLAMGVAARETVLRNFTVRHYEDRQLAVYEALLAGTKAAAINVRSNMPTCEMKG